MADVLIGQGISAAPRTGQGEILWDKVRRSQYTLRGFPASTTTPFSALTPPGILIWDAALAYVTPSGSTPGAEFEMSDVSGFQIIISNNGSGQTLSGITLSDYDTLPSGIAVPSQSYTTATNMATGASVTLSSLNLANNAAIRLWVPVNNGCLRQLYLNPTYAAAVTAGTGSLEVRVIPEYSSVALKGSLAPLSANAPTLLATIPYSSFAANTTYVAKLQGVLLRNARSRTILVYSSLNQAFSSNPTFAMADSSISYMYNSFWGTGAVINNNSGFSFTTNTNLAYYAVFSASSEDAVSPNPLSLAVDSIAIALPMGATAPTSGNVYILKNEVI